MPLLNLNKYLWIKRNGKKKSEKCLKGNFSLSASMSQGFRWHFNIPIDLNL